MTTRTMFKTLASVLCVLTLGLGHLTAHAESKSIAGFDLWGGGCTPESARGRLAQFQAGGKQVAVWTINDPALFRRWLEAGAAWVVTDVPWKMA